MSSHLDKNCDEKKKPGLGGKMMSNANSMGKKTGSASKLGRGGNSGSMSRKGGK